MSFVNHSVVLDHGTVWFSVMASVMRLYWNAVSVIVYRNMVTTGRRGKLVMVVRLSLKCDGTRPETRFRLSAKRTSPFKSAGASVHSTTGSRGVRISGSKGSNAGYTMFRGSVKSTGYPLHSPVSPLLPLPCVTVCHHISAGQHRCAKFYKEGMCLHKKDVFLRS